MAPHSSTLAWKIPWMEEPGRLQSMGLRRVGHDWATSLSLFTLEKEMATHSSVLAWRIPGTVEPNGLLSMGSHRVGHDWSDIAAAAAAGTSSKNWLIGKDSDAGRDWGQEEKGTTEDEMAGWHPWLNGRESECTQGVGDGQGGLACCDSWGCKESDTTERLNWTELKDDRRKYK